MGLDGFYSAPVIRPPIAISIGQLQHGAILYDIKTRKHGPFNPLK
jgi:hypothetical protein